MMGENTVKSQICLKIIIARDKFYLTNSCFHYTYKKTEKQAFSPFASLLLSTMANKIQTCMHMEKCMFNTPNDICAMNASPVYFNNRFK